MIASLWDMVITVLGAAAVLAQTVSPSPFPQSPRGPLPGSGELFTRTSSNLVSQPFAADPTADAQQTGTAEVEAFIFNSAECVYTGQSLWYRLYVGNTGSAVARSVNVQFQYPAGTTIAAADPEAERQDPVRRFLEWSVAALAPRGGYSQYSVTAQVQTTGEKQSVLIVTYLDEKGQIAQVVTTHTIPGDCSEPNAPTKPRSSKLPAIFCDPAETSCVQFLPKLGIRFGLDQSQRYTEQGGPILGVRFNEAVADILPGDCRVAADDVITAPEYHDALNRLFDPAAFFIQPLYNSGLDFKRLVHENNLLGIGFTKEARQTLQELHTSMWREHVETLNLVTTGRISGQQGQVRLEGLLRRWQGNLDNVQSQMETQYGQMQSSRRAKFQPVADKAIENAKLSMERACNISSDGGLTPLLPPVKEQYEQALNVRRGFFAQTQLRFRNLIPVTGLWQQRLYPALQAWDDGDEKPLKEYLLDQGQYSETLFESMFSIYTQHQKDDITLFEHVRLEAFEKALDTPKEEATKCEKEKVFRQPVETTFCESGDNSSIPQVLGPAAAEERARNSEARPPEGITEEEARRGVNINDSVKGKACEPTAELPGAPWWSRGCECKCNDQIPTGIDAEGNITFTTCQEKFEIVRHDTAVESQVECFAQAEHHPELYF